jgi:hypothetical protein
MDTGLGAQPYRDAVCMQILEVLEILRVLRKVLQAMELA